MKKIYQIPETHIVKIQTAQIIASSPGYSTTQTTTATSGNLSRDVDFFEDEDF